MNEEFGIRLYAKGQIFREGLATKDALKILCNFSEIYEFCIEKSNTKFAKGEQFLVSPELKIDYIKNGSLSSLLFVDFPAAYAMIRPLVSDHAWSLFKQSLAFVKSSIELIKKKNEIPRVNVSNSPGAIVFAAGRDINVPADVFDVAKRKFDNIADLAKNISPGNASFLDMKRVSANNKIIDRVKIDTKTSPYYSLEPKEFIPEEENEITCSIYKFNKRSLLGSLETDIDGVMRPFNFEAIDGDVSHYLESMKRDYVRARVKKKIQVNAFGESRVVYLYITGIDFLD